MQPNPSPTPAQAPGRAAHQEDWHLQLVCPGHPDEGYEITNGDPEYPHGCVTPFVFSHERAVLMTAAPAMYRALRKALNYIEATEGELGITLDSGEDARAALALATAALSTSGNPDKSGERHA